MKKNNLTNNPSQTKKLGEALAREILLAQPEPKARAGPRGPGQLLNQLLKKLKGALVIGLEGGLAAGKTTFLQGFAKGLGIKEKILSPTFIILKKLEIQNSSRHQQKGSFTTRFLKEPVIKFQNFYHLDCYRIKKPKEILDLEFKKIISNPQNIVAIEWPGQIRKIIPKRIIWITFSIINKNIRKINISFHRFKQKRSQVPFSL